MPAVAATGDMGKPVMCWQMWHMGAFTQLGQAAVEGEAEPLQDWEARAEVIFMLLSKVS